MPMVTALKWAVVGFVAGAALMVGLRHDELPRLAPESSLPSFELQTHAGAPFTQRELSGRNVLLYFGYTHCPDACPIGLFTVRQILDRLPQDDGPLLALFVTLDPDRDTHEVLGRYVSAFHPGIVGLTGQVEQIRRLADAYDVQFEKRGDGPDYTVDHSTFLYLLGRAGQVRRSFPHGVDPVLATDIIREELSADG